MSLDIYFKDPTATYSNSDELHWQNITHNLCQMANEAGLYKPLWRPDEIGVKTAGQLIKPLKKGIKDMKKRPNHYEQFDAKNGWGTCNVFIPWLEELLEACENYPEAIISVSR